MRKSLSVILFVIMIFGTPMNLLADENMTITQDSKEKSGEMNIDYNVGVTYTVTIPANVTFTDTQKTVERALEARNVFINEGSSLHIDVSSLNDFKMKNGEGYIDYNLKVNANEKLEENHFTVLTVHAGENSGWAVLNFTTDLEKDDALFAGNYTDTLTFTVTVE